MNSVLANGGNSCRTPAIIGVSTPCVNEVELHGRMPGRARLIGLRTALADVVTGHAAPGGSGTSGKLNIVLGEKGLAERVVNLL